MKMEALLEGSPVCPLVRLYDFTAAEASALHAQLADLAAGRVDRVEVHGLPFVEVVGTCRLVLRVVRRDAGAVADASPGGFACGFTAGTWDNVAGLVEPFLVDPSGYQWLADGPGDVALLLSGDGRW